MASLQVILRLSIATLWENKLRSILTLIGMVFGNAAVIATLSSNEGAKVYIAKQLASLGNKLMTVDISDGSFSDSDLKVIQRFADEIELGVREQSVGSGQARNGDRATNAQIMAVDQDYFKAMNLEMDVGRFFLAREAEMSEPVAILGQRARSDLFRNRSFMNEYISVAVGENLLVLRVIGAFKEKGVNSGTNADSSIYISPGLGRKIGQMNTGKIILLLKDDNRSTIAKNQVKSLLLPKYGDGLQIADAREAIERTKSIWSKQNLVGICLAAISLLTGGVGIMNIMLLSIHQRQKEIGLRKAVGAQNTEIAVQFLMETVIICVLGGVLGVCVGWGFGKQVASMLGDWDASMSILSVCVALGFSVLTGIVFGAAPAMRAARIDPYDALRTG
jgi:putative ABC transport system permease protein